MPEVAATPRCKELLLRPRLFEGAYERSVFTVDSFASAAECQALVDAAHRLLDSYGNAHVQPARSRLSIVSRIDQVLRLRLLTLLEAELPDFAHSIFGQSTGLAELRPEQYRRESHGSFVLFGDSDMYAFCDFILRGRHPSPIFEHWTAIDATQCSLSRTGCLILMRVLQLPGCKVHTVRMF